MKRKKEQLVIVTKNGYERKKKRVYRPGRDGIRFFEKSSGFYDILAEIAKKDTSRVSFLHNLMLI